MFLFTANLLTTAKHCFAVQLVKNYNDEFLTWEWK